MFVSTQQQTHVSRCGVTKDKKILEVDGRGVVEYMKSMMILNLLTLMQRLRKSFALGGHTFIKFVRTMVTVMKLQ
jgi:hypothetical protein